MGKRPQHPVVDHHHVLFGHPHLLVGWEKCCTGQTLFAQTFHVQGWSNFPLRIVSYSYHMNFGTIFLKAVAYSQTKATSTWTTFLILMAGKVLQQGIIFTAGLQVASCASEVAKIEYFIHLWCRDFISMCTGVREALWATETLGAPMASFAFELHLFPSQG